MDGPRGAARAPLLRVAQITLVAVGVIAVAAALFAARGIALLILLGFLIAAGLDPMASALTRHGLRRGLAVTIIIGGGIASGGLFVVFAVTPAVSQFAQFASQLPNTVTEIGDRIAQGDSTIGRWLASPEVNQQLQSLLARLPTMLASSFDAVFGALSAVAGAVFATLTVTVLSIYFVLALPRIRAFSEAWLGNDERAAVMNEVLERVGGYVTGQLMVCLANGITSYIFFLIVGMPYAALLAVAVGLLDAVPQFGALLGGALGVLMALPVGLGVAIATLIFFIVYQQFENYFLAPRLFSRAVELSPLAVFVAVLLGGSLAGLVGAIAALPIAAALKVVMRYAFRDRLASLGEGGVEARRRARRRARPATATPSAPPLMLKAPPVRRAAPPVRRAARCGHRTRSSRRRATQRRRQAPSARVVHNDGHAPSHQHHSPTPAGHPRADRRHRRRRGDVGQLPRVRLLGHLLPSVAGRPGRAQAGAPADPLPDGRHGPAPRPRSCQVRAGRRRRDGQAAPARGLGHL